MANRYSDSDLKEFKQLINTKLEKAEKELISLKESMSKNNNGTDDTGWTFNMMEDGQATLSKEEVAIMAQKQEKFIIALKSALGRIENKTYGICYKTNELIPKERLKAVPHTTVIITQKDQEK
jgi:RNA polymerase-binding transcription factor DksA